VAAGTPLVITQLICGVGPDALWTLPLPLVLPLVIRMVNGPLRNCAEIVRAPDTLTLHVPVPLHGLLQPTNEWPVTGFALSVTTVPAVKVKLHPVVAAFPAVMVQLIPLGLELTLPLPVPAPVMVSG
jgi:hypothetical protein